LLNVATMIDVEGACPAAAQRAAHHVPHLGSVVVMLFCCWIIVVPFASLLIRFLRRERNKTWAFRRPPTRAPLLSGGNSADGSRGIGGGSPRARSAH
jgi:hypothetical protein